MCISLYIGDMNKCKYSYDDYWAINIPAFKDNAKIIKSIARGKRMPVGSYVASVLEKEIKKEARKNADCE